MKIPSYNFWVIYHFGVRGPFKFAREILKAFDPLPGSNVIMQLFAPKSSGKIYFIETARRLPCGKVSLGYWSIWGGSTRT